MCITFQLSKLLLWNRDNAYLSISLHMNFITNYTYFAIRRNETLFRFSFPSRFNIRPLFYKNKSTMKKTVVPVTGHPQFCQKPPPSNSKLTSQLLPLVKLLRLYGRCPILFKNYGAYTEYDFQPKSAKCIIFPATMAVLSISFIIFGILQFGATGGHVVATGGL